MSTQLHKSLDELYTIALAQPNEIMDILQIMRENFYYEETMFKSLCSNSVITKKEKDEITEYFDGTIRAAVEASPCILAIHKETSNIVGVNITALSENPKTSNKKEEDGLEKIFSCKTSIPPLIKKYIDYLSKINDDAKLFHRFPNVQKIWEFYAIAIDKNHRQLGLASYLINAGINFAKKEKISLVFGVFTSIYSRKSAEKIGMKPIMEIDLAGINENGKTVFNNIEPHNIVSVMYIEI